MRFRRRLVTKAIPTAYQGPKKTPPQYIDKMLDRSAPRGSYGNGQRRAHDPNSDKNACQSKLAYIYIFHIRQTFQVFFILQDSLYHKTDEI